MALKWPKIFISDPCVVLQKRYVGIFAIFIFCQNNTPFWVKNGEKWPKLDFDPIFLPKIQNIKNSHVFERPHKDYL